MTRYEHNPNSGTMGGRGQETPIPEDTVQHTLTIERLETSVHEDRFISAAEALRQRAARSKGQRIPYEVRGNSLTYTDHGVETTLTYEEAS